MNNNGFSFQKAFDEALTDEKRELHDTTKSFYVSDMAGCFRKRILKRMGKETEPFDDRTLRLFYVGNQNHLLYCDILAKTGALLEKEIPCRWEEYELSGRADALVQTKDNGFLLYEFKTTHSRKLINFDPEQDKHYIMQGLTYLHLLNPQYNNAITQLRLVLVSRDDLLIKELGFYPTEAWMNEITTDLKTLQDYWQKRDKELPPELEKGRWECRYCNLLKHCPNKVIELTKKEKKDEKPPTSQTEV